MVTDVLSLIDAAIDDWTLSGDAMRWSPPRPPEPNWDQPAVVRAVGFRYLTDVQGMDGYAAAAYGAMQLRQIGRSVGEAFGKLAAGLAEFGRRIAPAHKAVDEFLDQAAEHKPPDRPAWQSPYGPPSKRRGGK